MDKKGYTTHASNHLCMSLPSRRYFMVKYSTKRFISIDTNRPGTGQPYAIPALCETTIFKQSSTLVSTCSGAPLPNTVAPMRRVKTFERPFRLAPNNPVAFTHKNISEGGWSGAPGPFAL